MIGFDKAQDKYRNDPQFRQLVDVMVNAIETLQFSPGEIRQAAIFAEIRHQQYRKPDVVIMDKIICICGHSEMTHSDHGCHAYGCDCKVFHGESL